jgi:chorismate mutase/prephenate dehydrogenase
MATSLDELRAELAALDRDLLGLAARRQQLAQRIGAAKRAARLPTRDFRQERDVIERARATAAELGVPPELGEELVLALIKSSLTVQERDYLAAGGTGGGRRVLVIGGRGKFGRWLVRFLSAQGFALEVADPSPAPGEADEVDGGIRHVADWRTLTLDHELIAIATPMPATAAILARWRRRRRRASCSTSARSRARCGPGCARWPPPAAVSPRSTRCSGPTPSCCRAGT